MAGIYIHIPFCNSKCAYCGFYSVASLRQKEAFLDALRQEMHERKDYLHGETVETVYFGGGTPSVLSAEELRALLDQLREQYPIAPEAEITLEANPDALSPAYLHALRDLGFNRLSIGIQSFFDEDLRYLSRRHDAQHARQCLTWAKVAGFHDINVDLIYGLPTADADRWKRNLDLFFETGIPHLSAYSLTLEPNSILTKLIESGKVQDVREEDAVRDYEILCRRAKENGFLHYEVSNFCLPRHQSRHNSAYWCHIPYLGLGPSAHSFDGRSRQWNVSSVEKYVVAWQGTAHPSTFFEKEDLSPEQVYNEYVMLKLRTMWGVDLKYIKREMGERYADHCERQAAPLVAQGRLSQTREFLFLNDDQMLFADAVAEALFC